jgi:hypothetical protein
MLVVKNRIMFVIIIENKVCMPIDTNFNGSNEAETVSLPLPI